MMRAFGALYPFLRPLLFRLDPERAHRLTLAVLSRVGVGTPRDDDPALRTEICGVSFANPIGLAAGMDKDARALAAWNTLGFGFAEIGTVTPRPQFGNPRPRMWRIPEHRALINRLGFPSDGMESVALRLEHWRKRKVRLRLAINFGPNKDTPAAEVAEDYARLTRWLGRLADFVVINLSSPNTPGLRDFQAPERMRRVLQAVREAGAGRATPLLIKLAPDLDRVMLDEIGAAEIELQLDGIVATNTTLQREAVGVRTSLQGGLSGAPLAALSRAIIAQLYRKLKGRIPIIGVGGISNAEEAYEHIRAGASLLELYTGMIYEGPWVIAAIKQGLARLLARDGFRSISEVVGKASGT
jgi:dihydroorotate dehydrogenase